MENNCPVTVGTLYKTKNYTILYHIDDGYIRFQPGLIFLLINKRYNNIKKIWELYFLYNNKIFMSFDQLACYKPLEYFEEITTK